MGDGLVRRKRRLLKYAVDTFIDLLQQVTHRERIAYRCNAGDLQSWELFLREFGTGVGEDFIRKFILYGIQSWFNRGMTEDYSRRVRFSWVIGGEAIKRWRALGMEKNVEITRSCLKTDYVITPPKVQTEVREMVTRVRETEEVAKREFYNGERGLVWCIANTTLFHHRSPLCIRCRYRMECKEVLKMNYPRIYEVRGYGRR